MKKRLLILLFLVLLVIPISVNASTKILERDETLNVRDGIDKNKYRQDILNTPRVDETEKVYDFADLLTDSEEQEIFHMIDNYIEKYKMDLVILTIDKNNKISTERYGEDFFIFNEFGFEEKKRSGSLFIIDMDQRNYHLVTSGSMIMYLDDKRVDNILDAVFDDVKGQNYYNAVSRVINKLDEYGTSVPSSNSGIYIDPDGTPHKVKSPSILISTIAAFVIAFAFVMININKHKGIKVAENANEYIDNSKTNIYKKTDQLISTHTSVTTIPKDTYSGGGGGSHHVGGSSFHSGGGGHSFGGGGRHF